MSDKRIEGKPLRDDTGKPVTLFGFPLVESDNIPPAPGVEFGQLDDAWNEKLRRILRGET